MKCEDVQNLLVEFLENRLDRQRMSDIKRHLSRCQDCRMEWEAEKALSQWLGSRKTEPVSATFTQSLMARLQIATSRPPRWFDNLLGVSNYWAPALAAMLVLVFAGRTVVEWIRGARILGQQAVGFVDDIPASLSTTSLNSVLQGSAASAEPVSAIVLGSILIVVAIGGLALGIRHIFKN
jgi:predicted anti-sigma-YlaC factor YlaD